MSPAPARHGCHRGALLVVLSVVMAAGSAASQTLDSTIGAGIRIEQHLNTQVPLDLTFTDSDGRQVRLGDLIDKRPVVLSLVYYECPMLCTQVLNGELRTLRALSLEPGDDFDLITVSFDPGETPELARAKKKEYVSQYGRPGAAQAWHFLTGSQQAIDQLTKAVGFRYRYDAENDLYVHASGIMVLTPKGKLARYYYGVEYSIKDLRLGLVEAAEEHIGSPVDQLLLLCMHYDPATGKYGFVIMNSLRLVGAVTVGLMALFVVIWLRRERAHPKGGHSLSSPPIPNRN